MTRLDFTKSKPPVSKFNTRVVNIMREKQVKLPPIKYAKSIDELKDFNPNNYKK